MGDVIQFPVRPAPHGRTGYCNHCYTEIPWPTAAAAWPETCPACGTARPAIQSWKPDPGYFWTSSQGGA